VYDRLAAMEGGRGSETQLVHTFLTRTDSGAGACEILDI
jgi:hypothetical protein